MSADTDRPTHTVGLSRAYDPPLPGDGYRVLVDRVWPRGRTREELAIDEWARDIGPTTELRRWFGHGPELWDEFRARYHAELAMPEQAATLDRLAERARGGRLTLVYGARDRERNQAVVIAEEIARRLSA